VLENNHSDEMAVMTKVNSDLNTKLQALQESEASLKSDLQEA